MKLSFCLERCFFYFLFLIPESIYLFVISLLRFSISSWVSLGCSCFFLWICQFHLDYLICLHTIAHTKLLHYFFISIKLVVISPLSFLILVTWDFSLFSSSISLKFCQCCWSQRSNFCLWFSLLFSYSLFSFIWPNHYFLLSASFGYSLPFFY